jgi:vitamin B12 transporter
MMHSSLSKNQHRQVPVAMRPLLQVLALMALVVFPPAARASAEAAGPNSGDAHRVTGKVSDQSGAPLPRTLVEILDREGLLAASTLTNARGSFAVDLKPGQYQVTASLAGFLPLRDQPLAVTAITLPLNLTLEIPPMEEQIIVTATRTEVPLNQIGSSTTVVTGDQLASEGVASVADALRRVAGLNMVQSGGAGQLASLFIRGGSSNYTKVLIDGIEVNEPGGGYNFANMSTAGIDRIEIVRGPQSSLFGTDAVAGVVQLFTRRGTSEGLSPAPGALIEGGRFSTYRYGGQLQGRNERMDYAASFTRFDTDNNVANGSFNEATFTGNLGFRPSHNTELRTVFRSEAGRTGVSGPWAFERPDGDAYYRRRDLSGGVTFTHFINQTWTQKVAYAVHDSYQLSADPIDSGSFVPEYRGTKAPYTFYDYTFRSLNDTRRHRFNYQSDLTIPHGHIVSAGFDYESESGTVGDPDVNPLEAVRNSYGVYVQDQWSWRNRLFVAAGVRGERNPSFGEQPWFAAPRLSLAAHLHAPAPGSIWGLTKIKANFGLGMKAPTLVESYSNSPYFRGNPQLKPERSTNFDVGIEQHFASGRGIVEVNYFENHFRNQIGFAITDYATYEGSFFNIGKTRARGVETIVKTDLAYHLQLTGAYTFLAGRVIESTSPLDPVFAQGQELFRRPRHSGNADLTWNPGHWSLGVTGLFTGQRVDSDFSALGMTHNPGYQVWNLHAGYHLSKVFTMFATLDNVRNEHYMETLGYPGLPVHFRLGLRAGM